MAVSGWKKRTQTRNSFVYETTSIPFWSILGSKQIEDLKRTKVKPLWVVNIRDHTYDKNIDRRSFRTKTQALKFAKKWMKRHPRG